MTNTTAAAHTYTCADCRQVMQWDPSQEAFVDFYGVDVCREDEDSEYFAHDVYDERGDCALRPSED